MKNQTILFVPGKHPKPPEQEYLELLRATLIGGLRRVSPSAATILERDEQLLKVASWNFSYYGTYAESEAVLPWIHLMLERSGPSAIEKSRVHHWRVTLAYLYISIADAFPFLIRFIPDPAVRQSIIETHRYFSNIDMIGCRVREYVKSIIREAWGRGEQVLVIGHSMGSVIAYDSLWELWHEEEHRNCVDFLTIGSPLGTRFIQHRLQCWHYDEGMRFPGNIRYWTNISAQGDLVALDPTLADDFSGMVKQGSCADIVDIFRNVYNYFRNEEGLNVHRSYGYLVNREVCKVVAQWIERENSNE